MHAAQSCSASRTKRAIRELARVGVVLACLPIIWCLSAGDVFAATMGPGAASYEPGSTSQVPIVLALGSDTADRMAFSIQVTPNGAAPPLTENLGFVQGAGLPAPMVSASTSTISAAWLMQFSPAITGTNTIGHVLVPIPASAATSDSYTVHMLNAGASLGQGAELYEIPTTMGPDVVLGGETGPPVITITITLQQLGVDVAPTSWALGTMVPGTATSSWINGDEGYFTATNTGNAAQDFTISATGTTPSGWTPSIAEAGVDQYQICFGVGESPYSSEPAWICFGEVPVAMPGPVGPSEYLPFDLVFTAPLMGSTGGDNESFTISLEASAH